MTRKKNPNIVVPPKGDPKQGWLGFVHITLSAAEIAQMKDCWRADMESVDSCIDELMDHGYKLSFAARFYQSHYIVCSATAAMGANINEGYTTSAEGPTWTQALYALHYKIAYILNWGSWKQDRDENPDRDHWG